MPEQAKTTVHTSFTTLVLSVTAVTSEFDLVPVNCRELLTADVEVVTSSPTSHITVPTRNVFVNVVTFSVFANYICASSAYVVNTNPRFEPTVVRN